MIKADINGVEFSPEAISAMIIKYLKNAAE